MRLRSQRLDDTARRTADPVVSIVRAVGGVQAQDERAAALGIRVRGREVSADDIDRARVGDRSIVRAWCMRGTLHLIPSDLLPAL
ncbi:MAG TPA: crosslink repair DNA glycosylase YcaQ family protein, partial [Euzebyales bacterium]|nr:crosslink repair DNA glycosylase YcaQ family protein [Euzebyales bacterium]